ncbi:MAG: copper amine oxidase N-terminal domain-containing protein [Tyzzerella sp.]|uniref:Copper amine oxidase N-terminal domain-containing protein n=1 Tax=Candidatus Fimicola merdigallinarum TaxID=2840819 RepID=A0A9D9DVQ0_9FIRM|nr:copper amine oxidase N-terminal domain-containing protein [Candidatus Fimicola merdigallinarum]
MKKNLGRIILSSLAIASMLSMTAFANNDVATDELKPIAIEDIIPISAVEVNEVTKDYTTEGGKITSITTKTVEDVEYATIVVENDNMGMVFTTKVSTVVYDSKDGSIKTVKDLTEGMEITAVLPANSIMTMSLPPMTPDALAFVINQEGTSVKVDKFDDELLSEDKTLMLNIAEDTSIVSVTGSRQILTAEDIKGSNALVIYGATTRSLPAQTTPIKVVLLPEEIVKEEVVEDTTQPVPEPKAVSALVALREVSVSAGFEVKWTSNEAPVVIEKDGTSIEVTLGSTKFTVNGEDKNFEIPVSLKDGTMMVSEEILGLLK